ncbi:DUF4360 domain-containing protein [Candidatus Electronema sp. JC]|uniref:DUF4360 domain-containing protein n=1 Tax=Candidatus Electronema sp. JC TaxID=3401570 RepID=UPI003AA8D56E
MKTLKLAFAAAALALFATQAAAQVVFQAPMQFAGTGCKPGEYSFSGDGTDTLTVLFSAYDAGKPTENAASGMQRTACSFVVPVKVPPGFQVSTMTTDWRGFAEGRTELFREYFFAGQRGPQARTNPKGNYTERDNLMHNTWSGCNGGVVPLRINSSVRAVSNPSYIAVDTVDLQNKVVFQLHSRRCR